MNKLKLFVENFLVYGLGGTVSKVIPLVMVPVITYLLPDASYFGISDLVNTVVGLGGALAVMGMYDAMYRMFFEKDDAEYRKDICSTALLFTIGTSVVVFTIMLALRDVISRYAFKGGGYGYLVCIAAVSTLVGATNSIISAPTRMQNKRKIFLVMNFVSPVLSYAVAVPLILAGHYVIALPVAGVIAGASSELVFYLLNKEWFGFRRFKKGYLKPLLAIAVPLVPNFLIYWVFNSCDRLMIVGMMDTGAAGVYAVGSKLGHASQLIYTAFAGGWQFFAFSTMNEERQVQNNSKIFEYLGVISFFCTVFVFAWAEPVYGLLFRGDYVAGFIVSPYLFLAPLLQMLFQVAANQFLVVKKTWPNFPILSCGAVVNVILNLVLIPAVGIEGAAIATLAGYAVSDVVCVFVLCRMRLHVVSGRFVAAVFIMAAYIVAWRLWVMESVLVATLLAAVCAALFALLYRDDIGGLLKSISRKRSEGE